MAMSNADYLEKLIHNATVQMDSPISAQLRMTFANFNGMTYTLAVRKDECNVVLRFSDGSIYTIWPDT